MGGREPFRGVVAAPNETVEKAQFSYVLRNKNFYNQHFMRDDFQVLGFFDSLNKRIQPPRKQPRAADAPALGVDDRERGRCVTTH